MFEFQIIKDSEPIPFIDFGSIKVIHRLGLGLTLRKI